jgi:putative hydrolase of the HAD superfamily
LKVVVLSNMPIEISRYMRQYAPWFKYFDHVCFSAEVQLAKPDAAIFHACLKAVRSRPEECLFIDDRAENVEAARALGMQALIFESVEQLAADVKPYDLPVPLRTPRPMGMFRDQFKVPEDFNAPLPNEVLALFEGEKPKRARRAGKGKQQRHKV